MRRLLFACVVGLATSGAAMAQSPATTAKPNPQTGQAPSATPSQARSNSIISAQKLKCELQSAGFSNVKVMAEAFVVQAKAKDGNSVVMTIGPHGFTAFEAIRSTTGSGSSSGSSNGSLDQK
jgi:hypothetical protein